MTIRSVPSFLPTKKTGAAYGEVLGRMNPCARNRSSWHWSSLFSAIDRRCTGLAGGLALGSVIIRILSSPERMGGRPGGSLAGQGNTSANKVSTKGETTWGTGGGSWGVGRV